MLGERGINFTVEETCECSTVVNGVILDSSNDFEMPFQHERASDEGVSGPGIFGRVGFSLLLLGLLKLIVGGVSRGSPTTFGRRYGRRSLSRRLCGRRSPSAGLFSFAFTISGVSHVSFMVVEFLNQGASVASLSPCQLIFRTAV